MATRKPRKTSSAFRRLEVPAKLPESFEELGLRGDTLAALEAMGFEKPTPIQALAIPVVKDGTDVVAMAETGSGKTVAFGCPLIEKIEPSRVAVQALVLCPTRELAQQVAGEMERISAGIDIRIQLLIGGEMVGEQMLDMKRNNTQVIVGTPGRVLDLCKRRFISIEWVEMVVLDEGDEMLDMGFIDDVAKILERTPDYRQTVLFSATFPEPLKRLATRFMKDPIEVSTLEAGGTVGTVTQFVSQIREDDIPARLTSILKSDPDNVYIVFCERKRDVDWLQSQLLRRRLAVAAIHGDYKQDRRFKVMEQFRNGEVRALVATDIASRGLDISHITHVVNVGVPQEPERYIHRIGRTGRAGRSGIAITFVPPKDRRRWQAVLKHTGDKVQTLPDDLRRFLQAVDSADESTSKDTSNRRDEARDDGPRQSRRPQRGRSRSSSRDQDNDRDRNRSSGRDRDQGRDRDRDRDQDRDQDRDRDRDRSSGRGRDQSRDRDRDRSSGRGRDQSRDRDRDRSSGRGRDQSRDSDRDRDQDRDRDRSSGRGRDQSRDRDRDRDQDRDRDRDRSSGRGRDQSRDRDRDQDRDRDRDRSSGRGRDQSRDRDRDQDRDRDRDRSSGRGRDQSRDRDRDQDRDRDRDRSSGRGRSQGRDRDRDRDRDQDRDQDREQNRDRNQEPARKRSPARKSPASKSTASKSTASKTPAKKTPVRKAPQKKSASGGPLTLESIVLEHSEEISPRLQELADEEKTRNKTRKKSSSSRKSSRKGSSKSSAQSSRKKSSGKKTSGQSPDRRRRRDRDD